MNKDDRYLSDIKDKTSVSARVNSLIIDMYKESEIPISLVIESSLINFLKLEDDDKIKFLSENLPEKVEVSELKKTNDEWKTFLNKYLKNLAIVSSVSTALLAGTGIGAISLIGGVLGLVGLGATVDKMSIEGKKQNKNKS